MLMDLDHAISGSKCLWMLYKILHIFPLDSRWILVEHLFGERFYRLFFHWSWNIRQVFYHLFLYQLVFSLEDEQKGEHLAEGKHLSVFVDGIQLRGMGEKHIGRRTRLESLASYDDYIRDLVLRKVEEIDTLL